jgi:hypothetical protein
MDANRPCARAASLALITACGGCGSGQLLTTGSDASLFDAWTLDSPVNAADASADSDATDASDAAAGTYADAGAAALSLGGRVPQKHRPSGTTCPAQRGAAPPLPQCGCPSTDGGPCGCASCASNANCDAGVNGRCENPPGAPFNYPGCSYDQCFSDSDCDAGVPCACRASSSDSAANQCMTGGDCRVDGDCGSNGFCSPSLVGVSLCQCPGAPDLCGDSGLPRCYAGTTEVPCECGDRCGHAYYCHTACDQCVDDSDCDGGATCNYDIITHGWTCQTCWPIP